MDRQPVEKEGYTGKEPTTAPKPMMRSQGMSREQLDYQRGVTSGTVRSNVPGAVNNIPSDKEQPVRQPLLPRPAFRGAQNNQERGGQYRREEELNKAGGAATPQKDRPYLGNSGLSGGHGIQKPIPVAPVSQEGRAEDQAKVIMVVDDSQTVRNIMALILHRAGYRSIRVSSAMEALHTLTELIPDLIFLDITLPGMDGLDVCKIIKENPRTKQVPVIMLSGNNEVFDKVMGRLAGASDYITKPFEPEVILNCINSFLEQKKSLREGLWQGVR
jgi:CheY-like chemotaxis protein